MATAPSLVPAGPIERTAALYRARTSIKRAVLAHLRLPPKLTGSEWAERHRIVSTESSARPGPWSNELVPYGIEIMDVICGPTYTEITVVAPSQSAKTELCINNPIGYFIDQEPSPILVIQPNEKPMGVSWSKNRLAPMLRDCPRLAGKVKNPRSRDSGNTILEKSYPGGDLAVVGANSPAGLASRPRRVLLCDELDRWEDSAGTEGDPLAIARARTKTYGHRKKIVKVSSPGNEGESRIEKEWEKSDQRHYYVPCPHCGEYQPMEWRDTSGKPDIKNGRGDYRLVWDKTLGEDGKAEHHPETACYVCRQCGVTIEETHKAAMAAAGKWVRHNPRSPHAGFAISGFLLPWVRWSEIGAAWLAVRHDPEQRKVFFNTVLGLLYAEEGEQPDATKLTGRRETWEHDVPMRCGVLTLGVDVQGDRLEALVHGWGAEEECALVYFERLYGDPREGRVWQALEAILNREWIHESGAPMEIMATGIDANYLTDTVMQWVQPRQMRRVYAVQGKDEIKVPIQRAQRANRDKVKTFSFNPTFLKDVLFSRLKRVVTGPGYIHIGEEAKTGIGEEFLLQYGSEKRIVEYENGRPKVRYILLSGRRNEAIDLYNLNLVALRSLGAQYSKGIPGIIDRLRADGERRKADKPAPEPQPQPRRRTSSWVGGNW